MTGPAATEPAGRSVAANIEPGEGVPSALVLARSGFELVRQGVERAVEHRSDPSWLADAWADQRTRVLVVQDGRVMTRFTDGSAELEFVPPEAAPQSEPRFLLGVDDHGTAYFGVGAALPDDRPGGQGGSGQDGSDQTAGPRPAGLRDAGPLLSDRDAVLLTHAVALANWHAVSGYCAKCGAPTKPESAGHSRRCTAQGTEHFPRTDPAVIMLVTDPDDRCLLARNAAWPEHRFSVLAGFVDPGESAEQAVAREVHEEVGIWVKTVTYAGSQPWPMPHQLMLGFRAEAADTEIRIDDDEIAEARWYSRDDLRAACASGEILLPPARVSISQWLIETWYGADLYGQR